jgi:1-acyl-sn-glycerol-3-phosphate acyltransferase
LTLAYVAISLIALDLVQRTVISLSVRLLPSRRHRILAAWQQLLARLVLGAVRFPGGARIDSIPVIPGRPGVLVLMNHQSLLDIPLVVRAIRPGYPLIVTRERYANGKPLISHMIRLYQYPTVNPRATVRTDLERLSRAVPDVPVPLVIYPEGTRTRDGELGRFKRNGLRAILAARSWEVWMVTADGYWECARLKDFRANVSSIRGRLRVDGPFQSPDPDEGMDALESFIDEAHRRMAGFLAELRGADPR